jgi:uncharacterized membrane protein
MKINRDAITDQVSSTLGSWKFVIGQLIVLVLWIVLGQIIHDPYPFLFLNLALSIVSSLSAPLIMMSQNRQEERDSQTELTDLTTDLANEQRLEQIQATLARLEENLSFPRRKKNVKDTHEEK